MTEMYSSISPARAAAVEIMWSNEFACGGLTPTDATGCIAVIQRQVNRRSSVIGRQSSVTGHRLPVIGCRSSGFSDENEILTNN
jgi:hypothetical protein